jgi:hypothetical protein
MMNFSWRRLMWIACLLLIVSCVSKKSEAGKDPASALGLRQTKQVNGVQLELSYMPRCPEKAAQGAGGVAGENDLSFRLRIIPARNNDLSAPVLSYGIDTLFDLQVAGGSVAPLMAQRIANGNVRGLEYLLVFDRNVVKEEAVCKVIFKDYLFTNTLLTFPVDIRNANKLDAISCNL